MPTKQPMPPPQKKRLVDHRHAEMILDLAIGWRRECAKKDKLAQDAYASAMGSLIDDMVFDSANPPTSPPPPRKR